MGAREAGVLILAVLLGIVQTDPRVASGFDHFYNLEYDEAIADFDRAIAAHPDDPSVYNHLAQSIQFREMLRSGSLESEMVTRSNPFLRRSKMYLSAADQRRYTEAVEKSMQLSQARIRKNPRDAEAYYALAVSHALSANFNFLVRKAWLDSLRDATTARKMAVRALEADPGLIDARLITGAHDYIAGSLPLAYRVLGLLAGVRGDREGGVRTLEEVARKGQRSQTDAQVLLAAIYRREGRSRAALPLLKNLMARYPRNFLIRFELALMGGESGDLEGALAVLTEVDRLQQARFPGYDRFLPEKVCYFRGNLLFWYNRPNEAIANLTRAAARSGELDLNTAVMIWLRLGQTYDTLGRRQEAVAAYRKAVATAPGSDAAREARAYLASMYRRP